MKKVLLVFALFVTANLSAAGYSNWAVPEYIELVSGGVLVRGNFGDPNSCGRTTEFFYPESEPNYDAVLTLALSALATKKEMRFYSSTCHQVPFHHSTENINKPRYGQGIYIR